MGKGQGAVLEASKNGHEPASAGQILTRTVALVGHAPSTRNMAPYADGTVEVWTMNDSFVWIPRATRWWEIHSPDVYKHPARRAPGYMDWLRNFNGPVYMQYPDESIPNAVRLDMDGLMRTFGRGVFGSSFSWMIAMAVLEGFRRIELYGCDLASQTEYEDQRESTAYWIGLCRGMGIDFHLPVGCPLLTKEPYGPPRTVGGITREFMDNIGAQIAKEQADLAAKLNAAAGKREAFAFFRSLWEGKQVVPGFTLNQSQTEPTAEHPSNAAPVVVQR